MENLDGEMKPAPDNAYEIEVCRDCLTALANDDYSGIETTAQAHRVQYGLAQLRSQYNKVIPDGAEYGFRSSRCKCCDMLPGNRYRVLCFDKREEV